MSNLCQVCVGLEPSATIAQNPYELHSFTVMKASAVAGCNGCRFFWDVIKKGPIGGYDMPDRASDSEEFASLAHSIDVWVDQSDSLVMNVMQKRVANVDEKDWKREYRMQLFYHDEPGDILQSDRRKLFALPIAPNSADTACFDTIKNWMTQCSSLHEKCSPLDDVPLPTRLVHVPRSKDAPIRLQLTSGQSGQYLALSHCWGKTQIILTKESSLNAHLHNIPYDLLSQTFKDAVTITRKLGYEYVWIDSLCIIQDNLADWSNEAARMATVYSNAAMVISAALAADGSDGMLRPRVVATSPPLGSKPRYRLQSNSRWGAEDLMLMPLHYRAWTFQERIMGQRIVHYMRDQLMWECDSAKYIEERAVKVGGSVWRLNKTDLRPFLKRPPSLGDQSREKWEASSDEEYMDEEKRKLSWAECVEHFSPRSITYLKDKLPALSGLASAFGGPVLGTYLAGLWELDFFRGLAWTVENAVRSQEYTAPTWSWASCITGFTAQQADDNGLVAADKLLSPSKGNLSWSVALWESYLYDPPIVPLPKEYQLWVQNYKKTLISYDMRYATSDIHGRLLPGCSCTVQGFCRDFFLVKDEIEGGLINDEDVTVNMDTEMTGTWHLSLPDNVEYKRYIGLQIAMKRCQGYNKPYGLAIFVLILGNADGPDSAYQRLGIICALPSILGIDLEAAPNVEHADLWSSKKLLLI